MNFPNMYQDTLCQTCGLFQESQSHLLQCPQIVPQLKMVGLKRNEVDENFIYSNIDNQLKVVKIYTQIMQIRKKLLDHEEPEED